MGTGQGDREDPAGRARAVARTGGRDPEPSAGLIDSQSIKGADTVGRESRGYDAGKKINGRKQFIVTDTRGLLLTVAVLTAAVQDRDGGKSALLDTRLRARVRFIFADGAFAGRLLDGAQTLLSTTLHIVRKPAGQRGSAVIPRRWAIERTLCAARRPVVSAVQPGGTWREVPGSNG